MDTLEDARMLQVFRAQKRLKLIESENDEPLRIQNELKQLILNKSRKEIEGLESQLEFLNLVEQDDNMSVLKLQEAFKEQISIAEKHWESLWDRKMHVQGALNNIIKMLDLVQENLLREVESVSSYYEFLCAGDRIVTEEILAQTFEKSRQQQIEALNFSIKSLLTKKEEILRKGNNRLEYELVTSRKTLKPGDEASTSVSDILDVEIKEERLDPFEDSAKEKLNVNDQEVIDLTCSEDSGVDLQRNSATKLIEIEDESTVVSSYSEEKEDEVEVSSSQSDNLQGRGAGKQNIKLRTLCNQTQLSIFLSSLEGEKKRVMENSIFKPFLSIPPRNVCLPFLHALTERYNIGTGSFTIDKHAIKFCGKEVEACLGLKYDGTFVKYNTRAIRTPKIIKHYFGKEGPIKKDDFLKKLNQMEVNKDNADDFFRLSVYYMFSLFFFPTTHANVSFWPERYLEKLEVFESFGWGRAIYKNLMESVRETACRLANNDSRIFWFKGCLPLLETLAYERIGSYYLKFEVDPRFSHPFIIKYADGEFGTLMTMRKVLGKVKFDKIKDCEDCSKEALQC